MDPQLLALNCLVAVLFGLGAWVYWRAGRRIAQSGGQVDPSPLGRLDVVVCLVWVSMLLSAALPEFWATGPEAPLQIRSVIYSSGLILLLAAVIDLLLVKRHLDVGELIGLRYLPAGDAARTALRLIAAAYPIVYVVNLFASSPDPTPDLQPILVFFTEAVKKRDLAAIVTTFVCGGLIAPATEEFLFRGYLHATVKKHAGLLAGFAINASVFALIHGDLPSLVGLFVLALALTAAYELTGSLLVPFLMHSLFNLATLTGVLIEVLSRK